MKSFPSKLNIWQEVQAIEPITPCVVVSKDEKNQASQETWFELLSYPVQTIQENIAK